MKGEPRRTSEALRRPMKYLTWLEWHKRSLRSAWSFVRSQKCDIRLTLEDARLDWAGHMSRFGMGGRPQHLLKHILMWRNQSWWTAQKQQNIIPGATRLVHKPRVGKPIKYELSLPQNWILGNVTGSSGNVAVSIRLPRIQ